MTSLTLCKSPAIAFLKRLPAMSPVPPYDVVRSIGKRKLGFPIAIGNGMCTTHSTLSGNQFSSCNGDATLRLAPSRESEDTIPGVDIGGNPPRGGCTDL